jgi:hypothetical protein
MSTDPQLEQYLRFQEERLIEPATRASPEIIDALLAPEFIEFGSSGRVFDKRQTLESLNDERPSRRSISDFGIRLLAPGIVLATYRAIRHGETGERPAHSLRSSIWKLNDGRWQLVFHQGTVSPHA